MPEPLLLRVEVAPVPQVGRGREGNHLVHPDAAVAQARGLGRVVRQQPHRLDAERAEHRGGVAVVPDVRR
jgi:hypothetical protein